MFLFWLWLPRAFFFFFCIIAWTCCSYWSRWYNGPLVSRKKKWKSNESVKRKLTNESDNNATVPFPFFLSFFFARWKAAPPQRWGKKKTHYTPFAPRMAIWNKTLLCKSAKLTQAEDKIFERLKEKGREGQDAPPLTRDNWGVLRRWFSSRGCRRLDRQLDASFSCWRHHVCWANGSLTAWIKPAAKKIIIKIRQWVVIRDWTG